ncbi:MAG: hypothetical protein LBP53_04885 [Candidatus Peribacteria bacterium]|jgi:hypothetical protein|nr:hypothetical protein [Candidatus Peribacteria bacterium]
MLGHLYQIKNESTDIVRANQILNRASQYVATNDMEGMRQCIHELLELMPRNVQANLGAIAGISK